jgi:hypothetical protein
MSAPARPTPPGYPVTPIPDLSLPETRERLSGSAIEGFFAIADRWHLSIDQAGALLGELPRSSAYKLRSTPKTLGMDQLTRIPTSLASSTLCTFYCLMRWLMRG